MKRPIVVASIALLIEASLPVPMIHTLGPDAAITASASPDPGMTDPPDWGRLMGWAVSSLT